MPKGSAALLRSLLEWVWVLQKCESLWNLAKCHFNGRKLERIYAMSRKTSNRGEFAVVAEDSSGQHWIIELDKNGTVKRRARAAGYLFYHDFEAARA